MDLAPQMIIPLTFLPRVADKLVTAAKYLHVNAFRLEIQATFEEMNSCNLFSTFGIDFDNP